MKPILSTLGRAIDSAISVFNPRAAMYREQSRLALDYLRSHSFSYDGAKTGRRTDGWTSGSTSANAEIGSALVLLRNRSRDLERNNRYAHKAVSEMANAMVGTGIEAQADTGDKTLNAVIQAEWRRFWEECDADGQLDFGGLQHQVATSMVVSGEVFPRFRPRRASDGDRIPLKIQILESDYVDISKTTGLGDSGYIIQGVEFDPINRRRAYWMFSQHPGEVMWIRQNANFVSKAVPAAAVMHVYNKERPGQVRGVPWLAPSMQAVYDLAGYEDAERFRKRIEACVVAFVSQQPGSALGSPMLGAQTTESDQIIEAFEPGMIQRLPPGSEVKFNNPTPMGGYREYKTTELQGIAAGWGITHERLTGDFSNTTFSSWRGGDLGFRSNVEACQWLVLVPMFLRPVWRQFIDTLVLLGRIPEANYGVQWHMPPRQTIDPMGDAEAERMLIRCNLKTLKESVSERGRDFTSHLQEVADCNAELDRLKIVSDTDPRNTTLQGVEQKESTPKASSSTEGGVK